MREFPQSLGLSGSLLIAHPNLHDPNFRRTVVYLSTHDLKDGSFGVVINRPAEKLVGELLPEAELGALGEIPVFVGGPVSADQLMFAAFAWRAAELECRLHLPIGEARELAGENATAVRAFIGYSGWSAGQLEAELQQKAWLTQKPDRDLLEIEKCKGLWPAIMREQGPWFRLLAAAPDDPSQN